MAQPAIRPATHDDVPAIARLIERAYEPYVPRIGVRPAPMDDDYRARVADDQAWVVEDDGRVVGVAILVPGRDHLLVETLGIEPERQGEGLGRGLLAFAEREAARRGMREVRLYTNEEMTENLDLYPRLGWEETGRGIDHGYRRVFFRKRLARSG